MRISKYLHSCLLVERDGERLLFDPGSFSFAEGQLRPEEFKGVGTIVITHGHPDHVDAKALETILDASGATVVSNTEVKKKLAETGIDATVLDEGEHRFGVFTLKAIAAAHEPILGSELPKNTAYVVDDTLLHPGDSYSSTLDTLKGIPVLALPVMAPWTNEIDTAAFAVRLAPKLVVPIHDGYSKEFFLEMRYKNFEKYFDTKGIEFRSLKDSPVEV